MPQASLPVDVGPFLTGLSLLYEHFPPVKDQKPGAMGARITEAVQGLSMTEPLNPARFAAMMEHNHKFQATWNKQRRDHKNLTQSGCDMALVCIALATEKWTPQQALSLLLEYRAHYQVTTREHYARWTIQTAINFVEGNRHIRLLPDASPKVIEDSAAQIISDEERQEEQTMNTEAKLAADMEDATALFREVEAFFNFPPTIHIRRVVCVNSEPLRFEWVVETDAKKEQRIVIGSPETVYNLDKIKANVYQVTRSFCFREGKKGLIAWGELSNRLRRVETTEEEIETLKEEIIRRQLDQYREKRAISLEANLNGQRDLIRQQRILTYSAYVEEERFYFSLEAFIRFVVDERRDALLCTRPLLVRVLRVLGANDEKIDISRPKTTRRVWSISLENLDREFFRQENTFRHSSPELMTEIFLNEIPRL